MPVHNVFVYGSLKKGFHNHDLLQRTSAKFVGEFITERNTFTMYSMGDSFPFVFNMPQSDDASNVKGELYQFEDENILKKLDMLEGHPHFYRRHMVYLKDFKHPVYMYITNEQELLEENKLVSMNTDGVYEWSKEMASF